MIQALNSVNSNPTYAKKNPNFGISNADKEFVVVPKSMIYPEKKNNNKIGWLAREAATGAAVSLAIDGLFNLVNVCTKKPVSVNGTALLKRAGFWALAFPLISVVISAFAGSRRNNN